jgi:hypothetical protein
MAIKTYTTGYGRVLGNYDTGIKSGMFSGAGVGLVATSLGGVINASSNIFGGVSQENYYKMMGQSYLSKKRAGEISTGTQIGYDATATAYKIRSVMNTGEQIFAKQKTAIAGAGGDLSSVSAQSIIKSSAKKQAEDLALLQTQNELSAFERRRQTMLEGIALENQARQAEIAGSLAKTSGFISGVGSLLSTAGTVASGYYDMIKY